MLPDSEALDQVYELAEAMNKYGPVIVILAVFLMLFLAMVVFILRGYMESQKRIMDQQTAMLNNLMEKEKEDKVSTKLYDEKNIVEIFYKLNVYLKAECKKFAEKAQSDRIGIYVFHNGTVASHGLPFFKVSCICEYVRRGSGICNHITDSTNLPLSLFDDIIDKLYIHGLAIVRNTVPGSFQSDSFYLDKDDAKTAIFTTVYDSEDNAMAFILGEYKDELTTEEIDRDTVLYKELCARLKPVLEFSEYRDVRIEKGR